MTKLNEIAKENRLIMQAVHKTYNIVADMLEKAKSRALVTNPDDKINIKKQMNLSPKGVRFTLRDHDAKSMMSSSQKVKSTKPIFKMDVKTTIDDQKSVNLIHEENDSQDDTESDHAYDHSSVQEANSDFLFRSLICR